MRIGITGTETPLMLLALDLSERGIHLWRSPTYPDGEALLVAEVESGMLPWLRSHVSRTTGFKTKRSFSDPNIFLHPWRIRHLHLTAEPIALSTLRVKEPKGTLLLRFIDPTLQGTAALLKADLVPYVFETGGAPLVYVSGSPSLRRALKRYGADVHLAPGLPIGGTPANRLSIHDKRDRWRISVVTTHDDEQLTYTLREASHAALIESETIHYLSPTVFVWSQGLKTAQEGHQHAQSRSTDARPRRTARASRVAASA